MCYTLISDPRMRNTRTIEMWAGGLTGRAKNFDKEQKICISIREKMLLIYVYEFIQGREEY